jgi:hypothetical protein
MKNLFSYGQDNGNNLIGLNSSDVFIKIINLQLLLNMIKDVIFLN